MLSQMEDGNYSIRFKKSNNYDLNQLIKSEFGAQNFNDIDFQLTGNLKDVYEKLQEIQMLAQNRGLDNYFNKLSFTNR